MFDKHQINEVTLTRCTCWYSCWHAGIATFSQPTSLATLATQLVYRAAVCRRTHVVNRSYAALFIYQL